MKVKDILKFFQISSDDETQIKDISDDSSFSSTSWIYLNVSNSKNSEKYIKEAKDNHAYLVLSSNKNSSSIYIEDLEERKVEVKEGDILELGKHKLRFIIAPMVHWPEVMMEYEETEKILFSADGFGKFGTLDTDEDWDCEARRYYFNIVGKYGMQVQAVLKKASKLDIKTICPLHGPILRENLEHYINKYDIWSKYETESEGVYIACASIHGNTLKVCEKLKEILEKKVQQKLY